MQIWVYFLPGAGGDGFVNLLNFSKDVTSIDQSGRRWNVEKIINGKIKFWPQRSIDKNHVFRSGKSFLKNNNRFTKTYLHIIKNDLNCVVPSHDVTLTNLSNSDCKEILLKNSIKVYIDVADVKSAVQLGQEKNMIHDSSLVNLLVDCARDIKKENFDFVISLEQIKKDKDYFDQFCKNLKIIVEEKYYFEYLNLVNGNFKNLLLPANISYETFYEKSNGGTTPVPGYVPEYISESIDSEISFKLINLWLLKRNFS